MPIGPTPQAQDGDLRIAVLETNPLVKVSAYMAKVVQATAKLLSAHGG